MEKTKIKESKDYKKSKKIQKILVTGATGFIGSNLTRELVKKGYQIHCLIRNSSNTSRIDEIRKNLILHECDLTDKEKLEKIMRRINPDAIFHLANTNIYGGIEESEFQTIQSNFIGTINLIKSLDTIPYKIFINTGSSSEYGIKDKPMKETDICNPESIYAITKLACTLFSQAYAKLHKKPIVTLRLFSPYGPYDEPSRFINYIIRESITSKKIVIENPKGVRDFVYIDDVIDAYLKCLTNRKKIGGEIINIGSGKQHSVKEVLGIIGKLIPDLNIEYKEKIRLYESASWVADIAKANNLLSWKPKVLLSTGIKKTMDFNLNQQ